jgi:hypothetical protein
VAEVYSRLGDHEMASKFRAEARAIWQPISTRNDVPESLRREAREALEGLR